MDVAEALRLDEPELAHERATDAVAEAIEFALPLAAQWAKIDPPPVTIRAGSRSFQLGHGTPTAEITGKPTSVLAALWGRSTEGTQVQGNVDAAKLWLSTVEQGFGGR